MVGADNPVPKPVSCRGAAVYVLSAATVRAIRSSGATLTALGWPLGFHGSYLSALTHGKRFGESVRARVLQLAALLGVPPDQAVRRVRKGAK